MDKDYSNKALHIVDYAMANEVLRSDSFERAPCGGAKIVLQNSLTTLNGELHQQRRSAALASFSPAIFRFVSENSVQYSAAPNYSSVLQQ